MGGSKKKIVVGSAIYKRIIEMNLGITCLYVDIPDFEVISWSLMKPARALLGLPAEDMAIMLLYEAPTGIAVFSFDGDYLNDPAKDFWECLPPLSLKEFIKNETVPSPIDIANNTIDDHLAKSLTDLCGYEKKLVVGSAEYKTIIEMHLGITCLHVDVPDCEMIVSSQKKPMHALSPRKLLDPAEDLALFLYQHDINFKPETVNDSIVTEANRLHQIESRERDHLKFLRLLLKDFMTMCGIDTKNWFLIHFATALKVVCFPEASYSVYRPDKIFSSVEYEIMKTHASGHDIIFSKIDVLSVYEDVINLHSEKYFVLSKLDVFAKKAIENLQKDNSSGKPSRTDLCTGSEV